MSVVSFGGSCVCGARGLRERRRGTWSRSNQESGRQGGERLGYAAKIQCCDTDFSQRPSSFSSSFMIIHDYHYYLIVIFIHHQHHHRPSSLFIQ